MFRPFFFPPVALFTAAYRAESSPCKRHSRCSDNVSVPTPTSPFAIEIAIESKSKHATHAFAPVARFSIPMERRGRVCVRGDAWAQARRPPLPAARRGEGRERASWVRRWRCWVAARRARASARLRGARRRWTGEKESGLGWRMAHGHQEGQGARRAKSAAGVWGALSREGGAVLGGKSTRSAASGSDVVRMS